MPRHNRRMERPREQVLTTALEMVAEQGLGKLTIAALAARLETSGGHLLYYFKTRDGLLLETLRWSEAGYAEQRAPVLEKAAATGDRPDPSAVAAFADVYLAIDEKDPRWQLWLELWARAPYHPELAAAQREIDADWHADLVLLLGRALPGLADAEGTSERLRAMWDGLSVGIVTGGGTRLRGAALDHTIALIGG
ncbi:TetR family transcriptional regulator C-terminal domain-containing protein [Nocardioides sp. BP30]|uniref:TetR/AcrR family transcriptional regulator n=1 Tax=Nocardioides sp. BP30 TaxID=3036374 RepID=UPI002468D476|nr:TetR family transcriptional regulator C-terminal domain-containing protein [Nocardioides sp. BP30]WGL51033.1 TetR family transcriptional regulator C-terminal domain-containing protein [Nocardioides sp. BP30]